MDMKKNLPVKNNELVSNQAFEIIQLLKNIQKIIRTKFEKCAKKYGFTSPQLAVIFHLYKMPSITLNELSNHMMLTKSTVSGIIDRLAKRGVVTREIPEDNRRIVRLSISEEFKRDNDIAIMKQHFLSDFISNTIKDMEPKEVDKIINNLNEFSLALKNDDSD